MTASRKVTPTRYGPLIGGTLGLAALVGLTLKVVLTEPGTLETRVDEFLGSEQSTASAQQRDVHKKIEELDEILHDPHWPRLPEKKQELVRARLKTLESYRDYEKQLNRITPPRNARTEEQLKQIKSELSQLQIPAEHQADWSGSDAVQRHNAWLADAKALDEVVYETKKAYLKIADQGEEVIRNKNAPQLPKRASDVLDQAAKLPTPERDQGNTIPGAPSLTYAIVFQFADVLAAYRAWEKVRDRLKPLAV